MRELFELYFAFFRIGGLTFGGGLTMLPMLKHELVEKKNWVTEEELLDYYAVGQCTPGIIAVNVSVFIGYKHKGFLGATAAALGMISPCLIIISLIAACLSNYHDNPMVRHALAGISACVAALIFDAVVALCKKGVKDVVGYALCFAMIGLTLWTDMNLILLVLAAGIIGIMLAPKKKEAKK